MEVANTKMENKNRKKILIIVDMQNDFLTGSLANADAVKIIPGICELIKSEDWDSIFLTRDTHNENYLTCPCKKSIDFSYRMNCRMKQNENVNKNLC